MKTLGINVSHNGSVAIVDDGNLIFYTEEERLNRIKIAEGATNAVLYVLNNFKIDNAVINGSPSYTEHYKIIESLLRANGTPFEYLSHHFAHAISSIKTSKFTEDTLVFVIDGCGDNFDTDFYETESVYVYNSKELTPVFKNFGSNIVGYENNIEAQKDLRDKFSQFTEISIAKPFRSNITKTYESVCKFLGYTEQDAGKIMGLSSYGLPIYKLITTEFSGDPELFVSLYPGRPNMQQDTEFEPYRLYDGKNQITPESPKLYVDLAASVQKSTQEAVINFIKKWVDRTGIKNICTAGGYFLNSICNQAILDAIPDIKLWSNPVSHDGGVAIGCAYYKHMESNVPIKNLYLGIQHRGSLDLPEISRDEAISMASKYISQGYSIAWHNGRSEAGPRALGNRSILSDPRDQHGRDKVNTMKGREWYRPLAGTCLVEHMSDWFDTTADCRFMMYVCQSKQAEKIPAMVHIDGTCRVQSLIRDDNLDYYDLINSFYNITGIPLVLNTSFNAAGDPLCETPKNSIDAFNSMEGLKALFLEVSGKYYYIER